MSSDLKRIAIASEKTVKELEKIRALLERPQGMPMLGPVWDSLSPHQTPPLPSNKKDLSQ